MPFQCGLCLHKRFSTQKALEAHAATVAYALDIKLTSSELQLDETAVAFIEKNCNHHSHLWKTCQCRRSASSFSSSWPYVRGSVLIIRRDKHPRRLLVWLVIYEEFSSQVWLIAYPNHSSNDSSQRASKPWFSPVTQPSFLIVVSKISSVKSAYVGLAQSSISTCTMPLLHAQKVLNYAVPQPVEPATRILRQLFSQRLAAALQPKTF